MRLACMFVICGAAPMFASAQSPVDAGWRAYEQAEFETALEAFDVAEARESLSFEDWVRLLEGRALVYFATENLDAMSAALRQLARVAPAHELAPDAPPEIARAFLEARRAIDEPLTLELRGERESGGYRLEASLVGEGDLALSVRTWGRVEGGEWSRGDRTLRVEGDVVEAWAEALGPGGARVRTRGSTNEPLRFALDAPSSGPNVRLIVGITSGAVGAFLIATLIAVLATREADTQPNPPMVVE